MLWQQLEPGYCIIVSRRPLQIELGYPTCYMATTRARILYNSIPQTPANRAGLSHMLYGDN
jgi:hypothetical protein